MAAFDGNGVFVRSYSWASDKTNGLDITASRFDTEMDGIAAALSNCVTRDNQGKPGSNLIASAGNTYDLGSSGVPWKDVYLTTLHATTLNGNLQFVQTAVELAASITPTDLTVYPRPFVDATRYGVVGDNSTDNATALTKFVAVLKQKPGAIGILPAGTILCSSATVLNFASTTGITLWGGSALNGTKLVYTGTGSGNFVDARSTFGFSMSGISLYHNDGGFTGNLISFSHDVSTNDAQHGKLERCAFGSIGSLYSAVGVQLDQATLITIDNCDFGALLRPIAGQATGGGSYSVKIRIKDCQFAGYGFYAIYYLGQGWTITGCNFQPNKDGLPEVIATNSNTNVDGLDFEANTVLDASGSSAVIVLYTASGINISGANVVGCGGSGAVFLQANAAIKGLTITGSNHITQASYLIQIANAAHSGWVIKGNRFGTITSAYLDHPEYVTGLDIAPNDPDITPSSLILLANPGFIVETSGLVRQWGTATVVTGTPNVITFPKALTTLYTVVPGLQTPSNNANVVFTSSPSATGVTLNVNGTAGSNTVHWHAIGKL